DVVAVGVEDEGAVVAGVVLRTLAGRTVVPVARLRRDAVKLPHRLVVARRERHVERIGRRLAGDEPERAPRAGGVDTGLQDTDETQPGVRRDRFVEAA